MYKCLQCGTNNPNQHEETCSLHPAARRRKDNSGVLNSFNIRKPSKPQKKFRKPWFDNGVPTPPPPPEPRPKQNRGHLTLVRGNDE